MLLDCTLKPTVPWKRKGRDFQVLLVIIAAFKIPAKIIPDESVDKLISLIAEDSPLAYVGVLTHPSV